MRTQWRRVRTGCVMHIRLHVVCLLLSVWTLLAAGCVPVADPAAATDVSDGIVAAEGILPAGWQVFEPELEFSSIAVAGNMVLAGGTEGLYRQVAGEGAWQPVGSRPGSFGLVKALLADGRGNLWIGHAMGLSCLPGFLTDADADRVGPETAVGDTGRTLLDLDGRKVGAVAALLLARDGSLYAGTQSGALVLSEAETARFAGGETEIGRWLTPEDGFVLPMVNAMFQDRRGTLWFGSYIARGGGLLCIGPDFTAFFNHDTGLADDYVTTIAEDAAGAVWVGSGVYTSGGAARFVRRDGAYRAEGLLGPDDGLAGAKVRHIHVDGAGNRWICSEYDGIAVLSPQGRRIRRLTTADGLPDNEVKQMAAEGGGGLWFACRRGMLHLDAAAVSRITTGPEDVE